MDINDLFSVLTHADAEAQKESPYAPVSDFADQFGSLIVQQSPKYKAKDALLAGLVTGLIGGASKNLSNKFVEKQDALASDLLQQSILGGKAFERPTGMSPSVFSTIQDAGSLFSLEKKLEGASEQAKAKNEQNKTIFEEALKNPYRSKKILETAAELTGTKPPENTVEFGTPSTPSTATTGTARPAGHGASSFESLLEKYAGDEELARAEAKRGLEAPDRATADENTLRTQFINHPVVSDFTEMSKHYGAMQAAIADKAPISDLNFTFGVMKILDPRSIVRETEQGQVIDSQSIPAGLLGRMNKAIRGEASLGSDVRADMLRLAQRSYENQKSAVADLKNKYGLIATSRGEDPAKVTITPDFPISAGAQTPAISPAAAVAELKRRGKL